MRHTAVLIFLLFVATGVSAAQFYRWVDKDGGVHYSDQAPPASAKKAEQRKIGGNVSDGQDSYALGQAVAKNPVLLFTGDCGHLCASAKALLDKRGIPYTEKDPQNRKQDADELMSLIGAMEVPVLKVGKKPVKGFDPVRWDAALDEAGYPKSSAPLRQDKTKSDGAVPAPAFAPSQKQ